MDRYLVLWASFAAAVGAGGEPLLAQQIPAPDPWVEAARFSPDAGYPSTSPADVERPQLAPQTRGLRTHQVAALAGAGSLVGLLGGTLYGSEQGSHRDLALGLVVGSFGGAALAGTVAERRPLPALLGSALGVFGGLALTSVLPSGGTEVAFAGYAITHGTITALTIVRGR